MNRRKGIERALAAVMMLLLAGVLNPREAWGKKPPPPKEIDSGSFGIYVSGKRVATEIFHIEQLPDMSVAKSEIKLEDGTKASQTAELQLTPSGDLKHYQWNELSPERAEATVEPQDQFLVEHMSFSTGKPLEQPYILPPSTMVLDDYFFSHREILLWRYLATACRPEAGSGRCPLAKSQFGVLVPRQRASMVVTLAYVGREKITLHGKEVEVSHFSLQSEDGGDWALYLDDQYKLVRVVIAANNTEVVRD